MSERDSEGEKKKKPYDAGDKDQVEKAENKDKKKERQRRQDLANILRTEGGRRFIWWLLGECGMYKSSFDKHSNTMSFNEGERNIGILLNDETFLASPQMSLQMMLDGKKEEESKNV